MRAYTRSELINQIRAIEAYTHSRPNHEQMLGLDAANLGSLLQQAAAMLMVYQKPAISGNRLLTMEDLLAVYDTDEHHEDTMQHLQPLEDKAGMSQWISWKCIRDSLEGASSDAPKRDAYLITWRLWLCKPTEEDCQNAPWE